MPIEMTLEELRTDLAQVMRDLTETGPVRITRHSKTVADIIPASLEDRKRQAKKTAELIQRLDEMDVTGILLGSPVGTLEEMQRLLDEWDSLKASGVPLADRPYIMDGAKPSSVEEILALMYFESDYPNEVADPVAWFRACADVQRVAHSRGLSTSYPQVYAEDDVSMVMQLVGAGHTPDSFRTFGVHALDQNVPLDQILSLVGEDAVPADVLAHPNYDDYYFDQIREAGFPLVEAANLVRQRSISRDDITFVRAGIRSLDDLSQMSREKINMALFERAVSNGFTFPEVVPVLRTVEKYKYKGSGNLHFEILYRAALKNVSLVRWDQSAEAKKLMDKYNPVTLDESQVLDAGIRGMSPSWVSAAVSLVTYFEFPDAEDRWSTIQRLHETGVSKELMRSLMLVYSGRRYGSAGEMTPIFAVLDLGLRTPGQVKYLSDAFNSDLDKWATHLRLANECQNDVDEFVKRIDTETWKNVLDVFTHSVKVFSRSETFLHETRKDILNGYILDIFQVNAIIEMSDRILRSQHRVPSHIDREELEVSLTVVKDSFWNFYAQHMNGAHPRF